MNFSLFFYSPHHTAFVFALTVTALVYFHKQLGSSYKKHLLVTAFLVTVFVLVRSINLSTLMMLFIATQALSLQKKHTPLRLLLSVTSISLYIIDVTMFGAITSPLRAYTGFILLLLIIFPTIIYDITPHLKKNPRYTFFVFIFAYIFMVFFSQSGIKESLYNPLYSKPFAGSVAFLLLIASLYNLKENYEVLKKIHIDKIVSSIKNQFEKNISFYFKKEHLIALCLSFFALLIVYPYVFFMGKLATQLASPYSIPDRLYTILPHKDTTSIHLGAFNLFRDVAFFFAVFFAQKIPLYLACLASLAFVRSSFVTMTNLGLPEGQPVISSTYTFGGDLFFSGNVAIPFMTALVFWDVPFIRYASLIATVVFGVAALVGRFHYSIDVFAAPFMAYGVFTLVIKVFPKLATWAYSYNDMKSLPK